MDIRNVDDVNIEPFVTGFGGNILDQPCVFTESYIYIYQILQINFPYIFFGVSMHSYSGYSVHINFKKLHELSYFLWFNQKLKSQQKDIALLSSQFFLAQWCEYWQQSRFYMVNKLKCGL